MGGGEDFLYRPVRAGMCNMVQLKDGSLDLFDIIRANEALDVEAENRWRVNEYYSNERS
jgi:hypothetical protein